MVQERTISAAARGPSDQRQSPASEGPGEAVPDART